jgi:hypothetical protein
MEGKLQQKRRGKSLLDPHSWHDHLGNMEGTKLTHLQEPKMDDRKD